MENATELEIDGIRCVWRKSDDPMSAGLFFGVGMTDERFQERGFTHLVEHLALHTSDRLANRNGFVDPTKTAFLVSGSSEEVCAFFNGVTSSLANLPFDQLERECKVLRAEASRGGQTVQSKTLHLAYGPSGPGVLGLPEAGLWHANPKNVDEWRRRYFVRENAVAFFDGPSPPEVSFADVPSGTRNVRSSPIRRLPNAPHLHTADCSGPSVSGLIPHGPSEDTIVSIAVERLRRRLREDKGISYSVASTIEVLSSEQRWLTISADTAMEDCTETYETMSIELRRLATDGPTMDEVADVAIRLHRSQGADSRSAMSMAWQIVDGTEEPPNDAPSENLTIEVAALPEALNHFLSAAIWLVPYATDVRDRRLFRTDQWSTSLSKGPEYQSLYQDISLRVDSAKLSIIHDHERCLTVRAEDVVGAFLWSDGGLSFYGNDGVIAVIDPSDFPGSEAAVDSFLALVRPERVVRRAQPIRTAEQRRASVPRPPPTPATTPKRGFRSRFRSRPVTTTSSQGPR